MKTKKFMRNSYLLTKSEIRALYSLRDRIELWREHFDRCDVCLNYGNGTVSEQLAGASCCLEMILQELNDLPF